MSRPSEASYIFGQATDQRQTDLAEQYGKSHAVPSHIFTGRLDWTPEFEVVLFNIIGDSEKVAAIKQAARRAYLKRRETDDV